MPKQPPQSLARDCSLEKEELIEKLVRNEQIAQNASEWFWEVDCKGLYAYVSPSIKKVLGYTPSEVVGKKHFYDFFDSKDKEFLKKGAFKAFRSKVHFKDFDNLNVHKNGKKVWLSTRGMPFFDKKGVWKGYRGADTDITERKQLEQNLKEHEVRFRGLFDHMSSAVAIYQPVENGKDFVFVGFNRAGEKVDGIKVEKVLGKKVTKVFPSIKKFGLLEVFQQVNKTGRAKRFPLAFYEDERITGWRENYVFKLPSGEIVAIYDDRTKEKQIQKELEKNEFFASSVLNATLSGLYIFDLEMQKNIFINPQYTKLSGYTLKDLNAMSSKQLFGLFHPEDLSGVQEHMSHIVRAKGREVFEAEYRMRKKDGSWMWCLSRDAVFKRDDKGRVRQFIGAFVDITKTKTTERTLVESEKKLRAIFDSTTDMMMVQDIRTGEIIDVNKATLKQTGYSRKELLEIGVQGFSPKGEEFDPKRVIKHIQLAAQGKPQHFEWGFMTKKGELRQTEVDLKRIKIDEEYRLLAVARDVTDKKKAETALRESEQRLKAIANSARDSIFVKNEKREYVYVNPAMTRLFGCGKECILGKTPEEIYEKESAKQVKLADDVNFLKGKVYKGAHTIVINGRPVTFQTIQSPLKDKDKKVVGCCGIVRNVTEMVEAKKKIEASERKYRSLFEVATDIMVLIDDKGVVLDVNKRMYQELGYREKEVVGKGLEELSFLFAPKSLADILKNYKRRWSGKRIKPYIVEAKTKKGDRRFCEITATIVRDESNSHRLELVVIHDVTDEIVAREAIKDANERLEQVVEKRTKELRMAQTKLVEQEKLAALGQMASVFAHEIRNPLGVMKLATYSLRKTTKKRNEKALTHLRHIDEKIEESNKIIHDMLVFARGTMINKRSVDVNELISKTCAENSETIRAAGIVIKEELSANLPLIQADPVHIGEVLCNIATNAAQAMAKTKKKELTVRSYQKGKNVVIEMRDTGSGISKEDLKHLGEPFFSTKVKGIGLGLYITYEIVKKHGGKIQVSSEKGKGTLFTVSLPI